MISAVDYTVFHTEVVAGSKCFVTGGTGKTTDVVDVFPGPHH